MAHLRLDQFADGACGGDALGHFGSGSEDLLKRLAAPETQAHLPYEDERVLAPGARVSADAVPRIARTGRLRMILATVRSCRLRESGPKHVPKVSPTPERPITVDGSPPIT